MSLQATVDVTLGSLHLQCEIAVDDGEIVAVLGPNGAGKSTLLRCLAGLVPLDAGRITLAGSVLDDPNVDVFVPPERRSVGVVFQNYLLFDHLSALDNVAFGLHARGRGRGEARRAGAAWLDRVGLADHAGHRPRALSGGQQQRVALARALATSPELLLLDEPLAALDAGARDQVRRDLRRHLTTFAGTRIIVTHDPLDAHALADRILVLEHGTVTQTGTLTDVTAHPRSPYVAELVGTTLISGHLVGDCLTTPNGTSITVVGGTEGDAYASIHPNAVALYRARPDGSPRNLWEATVSDIDTNIDRVRVRLDGPVPITAEITAASLSSLDLHPGTRVWVSVKATEIATYPA